MSVADLLPAAPLWTADPVDWWMYLDQLSEADTASKLQLDTVRNIAASLHRDPLLVPVMSFRDGLDRLITPWEPYLSYEPLRLAGTLSPCATWMRPEWIPAGAQILDLFIIRADPWGRGNSHPFEIAMTVMRDPLPRVACDPDRNADAYQTYRYLRWWEAFRNRFFFAHSLDRPATKLRFSSFDVFGDDDDSPAGEFPTSVLEFTR